MSRVTVISTTIKPRLRLNLVAAEDFEVGDTVLQCSPDEIQETRTWRTIQIDVGKHLKNEFLAYVDHSCRPNTLFDIEALCLKAIRPIPRDRLICFFYPGSEVELAQAFACNCGAEDCLEEIKGAFYLTREQMCSALDRGYCTSFIRRELQRLIGPPRSEP